MKFMIIPVVSDDLPREVMLFPIMKWHGWDAGRVQWGETGYIDDSVGTLGKRMRYMARK